MLNSRRGKRASALAGLIALVVTTLPVLALVAPAGSASAAEGGDLWTESAQKPQASLDGHQRSVNPSKYKGYTLDAARLDTLLGTAPLEDTAAAAEGGAVTVAVPAPTGELVEFAVVESPIMEAELAAAHPEIKTYAGNSVTDGYVATIRLDVTPLGFHASVISSDKEAWYIDPAYIGDASLYLSYFGDALPAREKAFVEPELPQSTQRAIKRDATQSIGEGPNGIVIRREYRLALVNDPSYAVFYGNTDSNVLAGKVAMMNRINQIYNDDLAVKMIMVAGTDSLNFQTITEATGTNGPCGGAACYSASDMTGCGNVIDKNTHVLAKLIGAENYDVGHIVFGPTGDGGGVAYLPSVGMGANKGGGCTGLDPPNGDAFAVDYVAHELGHQFNGEHTFNGSAGSCGGGNGNAATSVEPGSGTSIQAYAGICAQDNLQPHSDPYFSQRSQVEVTTHITGATSPFNEVQEFGLSQFGGTDGFTLNFGGPTTAAITNGTNYTAAGIKTAVEGAIGATVTASAVSATGFTLTYSGAKANTNIVNPTVTPTVAGSFTAVGGDYIKGGPSTNQGTAIATTNHNPTVTAPALGTKTIPNKTPFTLTGSGTDSDADTLTYLWEQNDPGTGAGSLNAHATGPLFRVFGKYANVTAADTILYNSPGENLVGTSPSRTFPDIEQIVANETNAQANCATITETASLPDNAKLRCHSEFLPEATYNLAGLGAMHFRLTARDLVAAGGGTHSADVTVNVSPTLGPFLVTSPNTAVTYAGNSTQTVTWSSGMSSLSANVKISLSTDGGLTYPTVIAASTPNDGTQSVTIPNTATTTARIKVEAVENYFFDISNTNFTITASGGLMVTPPTTPVSGQYSDGVTSSFSATTDAASPALTATPTGLPAGLSLQQSGTPGSATWTVVGTITAAPASYPATISVSDGTNPAQVVPLTVNVTQENATPTYTGPTTASAPSSGNDVVSVGLTATVAQATDGNLGDLSTATATFTDTTTSDVLCATAVTAGGAASCSFDADAPRTYAVRVTVGGRFTGVTAADTNLAVTPPDTLSVAAPTTPVSGQYSDGVTSSFTATSSAGSPALTATPTGLPAGLTLQQSGTPSSATWTVVGTITVAPNSYPATILVDDGTEQETVPLTVNVTQENASASYTGPSSATLANAADPTVDVNLTGTLVAAADGNTGDITTATADFVDNTTSQTLCNDVAVTATATPGTGNAACTLAAQSGRTYDIRVVAGGRYTGTSVGPSPLVVSAPGVPDTLLTSGPATWLLETPASFVFSSTLAGSTFACTTDGVVAPCTSPYVFSSPSRTTHIVSIAASKAGQTDPTPVRSVFTVPVDDGALKDKAGLWKRKNAADAYLGTYSKTKKKGAVLKFKVKDARALALIVGKAPKYGKVKVFLGKKLLKTVKLKGPKAGRQLVVLGTFAVPTSGKLRIVTASGKTVRIEGLGVATTL